MVDGSVCDVLTAECWCFFLRVTWKGIAIISFYWFADDLTIFIQMSLLSFILFAPYFSLLFQLLGTRYILYMSSYLVEVLLNQTEDHF